MGYNAKTQTDKNLAWLLPRPKKNKYKGGMPLYAEEWLLQLAKDILNNQDPQILNLFCGTCKYGFRIDIKSEVMPDLIADAHDFADQLYQKFDIILADPPYSNEEAKKLYGTPKLNYRKWSKEADKVLKPGGLFIVYHKLIMPNPDPKKYYIEKRVFVGNKINHLPRVAIYFRKKNNS